MMLTKIVMNKFMMPEKKLYIIDISVAIICVALLSLPINIYIDSTKSIDKLEITESSPGHPPPDYTPNIYTETIVPTPIPTTYTPAISTPIPTTYTPAISTPIPTTYISTPVQSITYKSKVDPDNGGFYQVRCFDLTVQIPCSKDYNDRTLSINRGDILIWLNDAKVALSIISEQDLWDGAERLEKTYTFNYPGEYTFYIKEYPRVRQTIIVTNDIDDGYIYDDYMPLE